MENIVISKIKKVVFNDCSSYEEERSRNGCGYGFWDEYSRTPDGKWEVSHGTTADMYFCPCCGGFGECMCGGEYETITDDELENLIRNFQESEDEWIEITYMEG